MQPTSTWLHFSDRHVTRTFVLLSYENVCLGDSPRTNCDPEQRMAENPKKRLYSTPSPHKHHINQVKLVAALGILTALFFPGAFEEDGQPCSSCLQLTFHLSG